MAKDRKSKTKALKPSESDLKIPVLSSKEILETAKGHGKVKVSRSSFSLFLLFIMFEEGDKGTPTA